MKTLGLVHTPRVGTTQIGSFNFNSLCKLNDGTILGASESGLYEIDKFDSDDGTPISALAEWPRTDFGVANQKRLKKIHLGLEAEETLKFSWAIDESAWQDSVLQGIGMSGESLGSNLVSNGDMEIGSPPTGWSVTNCTISAETITVYGGSQSLRVTRGTQGICYQLVTGLTPGNVYKVACKGYQLSGQGSVWLALGLTSASTWLSKNIGLGFNDAWGDLELYFTAPSNQIYVRLVIGGTTGQYGLFDNVSLSEVTLGQASKGFSVPGSRGLKGRYIRAKVENINGADFSIDSIDALVSILAKRMGTSRFFRPWLAESLPVVTISSGQCTEQTFTQWEEFASQPEVTVADHKITFELVPGDVFYMLGRNVDRPSPQFGDFNIWFLFKYTRWDDIWNSFTVIFWQGYTNDLIYLYFWPYPSEGTLSVTIEEDWDQAAGGQSPWYQDTTPIQLSINTEYRIHFYRVGRTVTIEVYNNTTGALVGTDNFDCLFHGHYCYFDIWESGFYASDLISCTCEHMYACFGVNPTIFKMLTINSYGYTSSSETASPTLKTCYFAGNAFIQCSEVNLTNYIGGKVILEDSTGKIVKGYIKEADEAESYGSEIIINGTMEADSDWVNFNTPPIQERSSEQAHGGTYSRKFTANSQYDGMMSAANFSLTEGKLYMITNWLYGDGTNKVVFKLRRVSPSVSFHSPLTVDDSGYAWPAVWTGEQWYVTILTTGTNYRIEIFTGTGVAAGVFYADDLSLKEVLHAGTDGVHIVSSLGGTTREFESIESGFDFNDVAKLTILS